ncbi:MAG: hypothetical protein JO128_07235, partial [Alphaproteobacteria bacterium]|nr:hypothetical protein [Alphaproteobacteria bacterium]
GLFYTSISLINVLLTPALVLTMVFAQHLSGISTSRGEGAVAAELRRILLLCLGWGGSVAVAAALALVFGGELVGVESFPTLLLIPAVSLAAFLFETIRTGFQSILRFKWFTVGWVAWCALQYVLAAGALSIAGSVWAGVAGLLVATIVSAAVMLAVFRAQVSALPKPAIDRPATGAAAPLELNFRLVLPMVLGYGLFTLLTNADILVAYLILNGDELGAYISSSVLPKAIITVTYPIAQVLLPVVVTQLAAAENARVSIAKAIVVTVAFAVAGALVLIAGGSLACGSRYGLRFCDTGLMDVLALAAVPLCLVRIFVVSSLATRHRRIPLIQIAAVAAFFAAALTATHDGQGLAQVYLVTSACFMAAYAAIAMSQFYGSRRHPDA